MRSPRKGNTHNEKFDTDIKKSYPKDSSALVVQFPLQVSASSPSSLNGGLGFFFALNRGRPELCRSLNERYSVNACQTRPVDLKPAGLKMVGGSFCLTIRPAVIHPAKRGNGFGWLPVCLTNPKSPSYSHWNDVQRDSKSCNGFAVFNPQ